MTTEAPQSTRTLEWPDELVGRDEEKEKSRELSARGREIGEEAVHLTVELNFTPEKKEFGDQELTHFLDLPNGKRVWIDMNPATSHIIGHLEEYPTLNDAIQETLTAETVEDDKLAFDRDLGRTIGESDCVPTDEDDDIYYAVREGGNTDYMRFVRGKEPIPTSKIAIILQKLTENDYKLVSSWIGELAPMIPGSRFANDQSEEFWQTHAMRDGSVPIKPETILTTNPWLDS